jgi:hypothetical protein
MSHDGCMRPLSPEHLGRERGRHGVRFGGGGVEGAGEGFETMDLGGERGL